MKEIKTDLFPCNLRAGRRKKAGENTAGFKEPVREALEMKKDETDKEEK